MLQLSPKCDTRLHSTPEGFVSTSRAMSYFVLVTSNSEKIEWAATGAPSFNDLQNFSDIIFQRAPEKIAFGSFTTNARSDISAQSSGLTDIEIDTRIALHLRGLVTNLGAF